MKRQPLTKSFRVFFHRIYRMATQPLFVALTVFGNTVILTSAYVLFRLEQGVNPMIHSYLDALWWSVSTVTTVGYGDVTPITDLGRVVGIVTIFIGAALFWTYTAFFAEALLTKDISDFELQLKNLSKTLESLEQAEIKDQSQISEMIEKLKLRLDSSTHKMPEDRS